MALVMDMCSGEIEMGCPADAFRGEEGLCANRNTELAVMPQERVAMVEAGDLRRLPAHLATVDVEEFLQAMYESRD